MLGEALLDLPRLLVGVNVQDETLAVRVATDLLEPAGAAGAHGVRCDPDAEPGVAERLDLGEVRRHGVLAEARETAPLVRDVEQHLVDVRARGRLCRGERLGHAEVVKLPDRRVAGRAHLAVAALVLDAHELGRLPLGLREHRVAPGPEVATRSRPAQRPLERVAVGVDEPWESKRLRHRATLPGSA